MQGKIRLRKLSELDLREVKFLADLNVLAANIVLGATEMQRRSDEIDVQQLAFTYHCDDSTVRRAINKVNFYGPPGLRSMGRPKKQ